MGNPNTYKFQYFLCVLTFVKLARGLPFPGYRDWRVKQLLSYYSNAYKDPCSTYDGDFCPCRQAGCEYNSGDKTCSSQSTVCAARQTPWHVCRRNDVWYSVASIICLNQVDVGWCDIEDVVYAVNFGGPAILGERGITYMADVDAVRSITEEPDYRYYETGSTLTETTVGALPGDDPLFLSQMVGAGREETSCDTHLIDLPSDGRYELSVRLKDGCWTHEGSHYFSIRLNEIEVFNELDILHYTKWQHKAADFSVGFEVNNYGSGLVIDGFPAYRIAGNTTVKFCSSRCQVIDHQFLVAAFSVVRFKSGAPPPSPPPPPSPSTPEPPPTDSATFPPGTGTPSMTTAQPPPPPTPSPTWPPPPPSTTPVPQCEYYTCTHAHMGWRCPHESGWRHLFKECNCNCVMIPNTGICVGWGCFWEFKQCHGETIYFHHEQACRLDHGVYRK